MIQGTLIIQFLDKDDIVWTPTTLRHFTSNSAYDSLCKPRNRDRWHGVVWGVWVQPKHSVLALQVCSDVLKRQDILRNLGIIDRSKCCLCEHHDENSMYLFFNCCFTKEVWGKIKHGIGIASQVQNSDREWNFILKLCKGRLESKEIYKVILCATLYSIWRERNQRMFKNTNTNADRLAKEILKKVRKHLECVIWLDEI